MFYALEKIDKRGRRWLPFYGRVIYSGQFGPCNRRKRAGAKPTRRSRAGNGRFEHGAGPPPLHSPKCSPASDLLTYVHKMNNENANENAIGSLVTLIELPRLAASSDQGKLEPGRLRKSVDSVHLPSRLSSALASSTT